MCHLVNVPGCKCKMLFQWGWQIWKTVCETKLKWFVHQCGSFLLHNKINVHVGTATVMDASLNIINKTKMQRKLQFLSLAYKQAVIIWRTPQKLCSFSLHVSLILPVWKIHLPLIKINLIIFSVQYFWNLNFVEKRFCKNCHLPNLVARVSHDPGN